MIGIVMAWRGPDPRWYGWGPGRGDVDPGLTSADESSMIVSSSKGIAKALRNDTPVAPAVPCRSGRVGIEPEDGKDEPKLPLPRRAVGRAAAAMGDVGAYEL